VNETLLCISIKNALNDIGDFEVSSREMHPAFGDGKLSIRVSKTFDFSRYATPNEVIDRIRKSFLNDPRLRPLDPNEIQLHGYADNSLVKYLNNMSDKVVISRVMENPNDRLVTLTCVAPEKKAEISREQLRKVYEAFCTNPQPNCMTFHGFLEQELFDKL
jgi:hypothetical protein